MKYLSRLWCRFWHIIWTVAPYGDGHYKICSICGNWLEDLPPLSIKLVELPPNFIFDWHRDYAPLWEPGSTAFWLAPEPGDLPAGQWPLPYIKERPPEAPAEGISGAVHAYYDEDGNLLQTFDFYIGCGMIKEPRMLVKIVSIR